MTFFDQQRVAEYDLRSRFDKGDRERQRRALLDVLRFAERPLRRFADLGCGTGFFAEAILEAYPAARGLLIDSSPHMLDASARQLGELGTRTTQQLQALEDICLEGEWQHLDLAVLVLSLHFVAPEQRGRVLTRVHDAMAAGGLLILIEQFQPAAVMHTRLLEYLACCDIQRRMCAELGVRADSSADLQLGRIVERDRRQEAAEGCSHMAVADYVQLMSSSGFTSCYPYFQETRFFGLLACKSE